MYKFNNTSVMSDERKILSVLKDDIGNKTFILDMEFDSEDIYFDSEYVDLLVKIINAKRIDLLDNLLLLNNSYLFMKAVIISQSVPLLVKYKAHTFNCIGINRKLTDLELFRMAFENNAVGMLEYLYSSAIEKEQLGNIIFNIDSDCNIPKALQSVKWLLDNCHISIEFKYKNESILSYLLKLLAYEHVANKDAIVEMIKHLRSLYIPN